MTRLHRGLAVLAFSFALAALVLDLGASTDAAAMTPDPAEYMSAPDLAARIIAQDPSVLIIDLRSRQDFELLHVARASHMILDDLARRPIPRDAQVVLYADDEARAAKGRRALRTRGYARVSILREGIDEWIERVLEPRLAADATTAERDEFERAVRWSRFFGGLPRSGVSRAEVPRGYWTGAPRTGARSREFTRQLVAGIRRRGC